MIPTRLGYQQEVCEYGAWQARCLIRGGAVFLATPGIRGCYGTSSSVEKIVHSYNNAMTHSQIALLLYVLDLYTL